MRALIGLLINGLIFLIKLILLLKNFFVKIFIIFLFKPLRFISRLFFYRVIVKLYLNYLAFIKRLGWSGAKDGLLVFVVNQKLVHVMVVFLTIVLVFINLTAKSKAETLISPSRNTILASLVKSEFSDLEADTEYIVESSEQGTALSVKPKTYIDKQGVVHSQIGVGVEEEYEDMGSGLQNNSAISRPGLPGTQISKRQRSGIIEYTVKMGDSISTIAEEFDISVNTILWENNLSSYSLIKPGMTLSILPVSGLSHTVARGETLSSVAKKYDVAESDIMTINKLADASQLSSGAKIIIPGGKKSSLPEYKPKTYTGYTAIKNIIKSSDAPPAAGNKMNWPTQGHIITQYYSWRHTGLDVANKVGTPLYAADSGTVTYSGWSNGYGYNVLIDHGGGKQTRYAHASKLYVKDGEKVTKGETIAAMGSTGWSTGSHIHFEVIINGKKLNPLNYIK